MEGLRKRIKIQNTLESSRNASIFKARQKRRILIACWTRVCPTASPLDGHFLRGWPEPASPPDHIPARVAKKPTGRLQGSSRRSGTGAFVFFFWFLFARARLLVTRNTSRRGSTMRLGILGGKLCNEEGRLKCWPVSAALFALQQWTVKAACHLQSRPSQRPVTFPHLQYHVKKTRLGCGCMMSG
ncbi:hypothetical protein MPH_08183 [Macrophomina phaseolina MS6]|uniref:Uncharacterized protein n=1 Tax=Macrophomina phaseolina (strain MS6) TaxID=1126212 RepID=K2SCZ2_MACPH|nr:hypothetical protein MPH_08183 [Macrophomina phaseolina MS6]